MLLVSKKKTGGKHAFSEIIKLQFEKKNPLCTTLLWYVHCCCCCCCCCFVSSSRRQKKPKPRFLPGKCSNRKQTNILNSMSRFGSLKSLCQFTGMPRLSCVFYGWLGNRTYRLILPMGWGVHVIDKHLSNHLSLAPKMANAGGGGGGGLGGFSPPLFARTTFPGRQLPPPPPPPPPVENRLRRPCHYIFKKNIRGSEVS